MEIIPNSNSITDILRTALKPLPGVSRVVVTRDGEHHRLSVDAHGRRVAAAVVYREARVVVPLLADMTADDELRDSMHSAVCSAATSHQLTVLHGVGVNELNWVLSLEGRLIRERELAAATMPLEEAHTRRLLADLGGHRLSTGVALLTGAPLHRDTLDFPLSDAERRERERLQAIVGRAESLKSRIWNTNRQVKLQHERITLAEERILESIANIAAMNAEIAQWRAELAVLDTPEAERERLEAAARLNGNAGAAS